MKKHLKQAVILSGGLGTRLRPLTDNTPKPMILVNNVPFLHYLLKQLSDQGISNFLLLTGYLGDQIYNYFGDGSKWGWNIEYFKGPVDWDTGRRLWEAENLLDENFLLLYSDNFANFNLKKILNIHKDNNYLLTLSLAMKDPGNISIDSSGKVLLYDQTRKEPDLNFVEIGYMVTKKDFLISFLGSRDANLSKVIFEMVKTKKVGSYIVRDGYQSISDPKRLQRAENYLKPKKILLLDRDGVINQRAQKGEYISKWKDFKIIDETMEALKILSKLGFTFIVISNQAGISRGMIREEDLIEITSKMTGIFSNNEIKILNTYICTHHWEDNCNCRKPDIELFCKASEEFSFRLDNVIYIGDDSRDCQAAFNANCASFFIGERSELSDLKKEEYPNKVFNSFMQAVPDIDSYYKRASVIT